MSDMKCPNCQHENKEQATFCEKCGAQLESEKKRMSFFERRQAKERERLYILSKSSLQEEDIKDILQLDMGEVEAASIGKKDAVKKSVVIRLALSILGVLIGVVAIYIIGRLNFNNTARVAIILVLFLLCFTAGAYAIDYGYRTKMIFAMCKSDFAVKKISYGKPPVMLLNGTFYDLKIKSNCDYPDCGAEMHIEEYNGEFIAVCNADRSHLRRLDCSALNPNSDTLSAATEKQQDTVDENTSDGESESDAPDGGKDD